MSESYLRLEVPECVAPKRPLSQGNLSLTSFIGDNICMSSTIINLMNNETSTTVEASMSITDLLKKRKKRCLTKAKDGGRGV
jgi:hypothetical protein